MDRLAAMRTFVAVADEQGFARAARRLGMSAPAVTRAVTALEERLGTRLIQRTTRVVRLTTAGARYAADCRRLLADIDELEAAVSGAHTELSGKIGLTAPAMFGRRHVAPVLTEFLVQHPQITAQTLLIDRVVDLVEEGLDLAVRIGDLPDSSLSAIRVGSVRRVLCASPAYLAEHGEPVELDDLRHHAAIDFSLLAGPQQWTFPFAGKTRLVRPKSRVATNTADMTVAAAIAGLGIGRLLSYQVRKELLSGRLQLILVQYEPPPVPVHVVHLEGRKASARVRACVDFMVPRLRADLARRLAPSDPEAPS